MIGDIYYTENLIPLVNQLISQLALQEISQLLLMDLTETFRVRCSNEILTVGC